MSGEPNHGVAGNEDAVEKPPQNNKSQPDNDKHYLFEEIPFNLISCPKKIMFGLSKFKISIIALDGFVIEAEEPKYYSSIIADIGNKKESQIVEVSTMICEKLDSTAIDRQLAFLKNTIATYAKQWPVFHTIFTNLFDSKALTEMCQQINCMSSTKYIEEFSDNGHFNESSKLVKIKIGIKTMFSHLEKDVDSLGLPSKEIKIIKKSFFLIMTSTSYIIMTELMKELLAYILSNNGKILETIIEADLETFHKIDDISELDRGNSFPFIGNVNSYEASNLYKTLRNFTTTIDCSSNFNNAKELSKILVKKYFVHFPFWIYNEEELSFVSFN